MFQDHVSGAAEKRPGLDAALAALQPGDVLTVWRLDRLGRSMPHLVSTVADFAERGIGFQSITEAMDTTTAGGELLFHVMGALAQFERRLNAERSRAGIAAARRRGKHLGRPADLTPEKITHARQMIDSGQQIRHRHGEDHRRSPRHPAQGFEADSRALNFAIAAEIPKVSAPSARSITPPARIEQGTGEGGQRHRRSPDDKRTVQAERKQGPAPRCAHPGVFTALA